MLLIELVQERCKILENKTTNSCSIKEKEDCWENLRVNFMSHSKGVVRSVQSLKTCWENMKKRTKKQFAEEKQAIYKTGGGQYKAVSDPIAEQVREIIRPAVEGLSNTFDSDCITEFESNLNDNQEFAEEWLDEGKLQTQISAPLRTSLSKRKSAALADHSDSIQNIGLKENDSVPLGVKEVTKRKKNILKDKTNNSINKLVKFEKLVDNKKELVNLMINNEKEKHEFEIDILKMQLQKEELKVKIMQKELELRTLILEKERHRLL